MSTDWTALKSEYVNNHTTLRALAEKHGASLSSLMKRCASEKWESLRKETASKVEQKALDAIIDDKAQELAKFNDDDLKIAKAIRYQISKHLLDAQTAKKKLTVVEIRTLAGAGESAQRIGRLALNAPTANQGLSAPDGTAIKTEENTLSSILGNLSDDKLEQLNDLIDSFSIDESAGSENRDGEETPQ